MSQNPLVNLNIYSKLFFQECGRKGQGPETKGWTRRTVERLYQWMAQTEGEGGRGIEEAQGKTGQAQGDQGWTRKEIGSTKEGIFFFKLSNRNVWG